MEYFFSQNINVFDKTYDKQNEKVEALNNYYRSTIPKFNN